MGAYLNFNKPYFGAFGAPPVFLGGTLVLILKHLAGFGPWVLVWGCWTTFGDFLGLLVWLVPAWLRLLGPFLGCTCSKLSWVNEVGGGAHLLVGFLLVGGPRRLPCRSFLGEFGPFGASRGPSFEPLSWAVDVLLLVRVLG